MANHRLNISSAPRAVDESRQRHFRPAKELVSVFASGAFIGTCLLFALLMVSCQQKSDERYTQPNIVFIMSDDHAVQAISAYGHSLSKLAPTPNIDRLAEEGALFISNYCANSICGPSRATVLTGKHSHKNGFMRNTHQGFDGSQQTLPKILGQNGYQTAIIGKWHLVSKPTGFDFWKILHDQGEYNNPWLITDSDTTQYMGYVTDVLTDETINWLDQRDTSRPFFLMMHHKAPHRNWVPAERHYHLFDDVKFPVPETYFDDYSGRYAALHQKMNIYRDMYEGHDLKLSTAPGIDSLRYDPWPHVFLGQMTDEEKARFWKAYHQKNRSYFEIDPQDSTSIALWKLQRYLEDYLAVIRSVDESVGKVLNYLKAHGLEENTIVVYTSDQGFYLGEHGWFDKRFMYEESMIMPLLMRWPQNIRAGLQISELTQNIDFAPTFLQACGLDIPDDMQGLSFLPLLKEEKQSDWRRALYYHYYEFPGFHSVRAHYGIKEKRYKLMHFYKEGLWELFDLENDPYELNNLYGQSGMESLSERLTTDLRQLQEIYEVPESHRN